MTWPETSVPPPRPPHVPPGYFTDPLSPQLQRYWDGTAWTKQIRRGKKQTPTPWPYGIDRPAPPPHVIAAHKRLNIITGSVIGALVLALVIGVIVDQSKKKNHSSSGGGPDVSLASSVRSWFDDVQDDFTAITDDETAISDAASNFDEAALFEACTNLQNNVRSFQVDPDAPDEEIRADLANAMDYYSTAASECIAGDYTQSASDTETGTKWIGKATARIRELGH